MTDQTKLDETCARLREELNGIRPAYKGQQITVKIHGLFGEYLSGGEKGLATYMSSCTEAVPFLLDAIDNLRRRAEAGETLREKVARIDESLTVIGLAVVDGDWRQQRDAALAAYDNAVNGL